MNKRCGVSFRKRVTDINAIYDEHVKSGLSNREIWRRYIYPVYGISERTFYNIMKVSADPRVEIPKETQLLLDFGFDKEGEPS